MSKILIGLEGVICSIDDVLVVGKDYQEHEERLTCTAILEQLKSAGITLNSAKCEFQKDRLIFLGHLIDKDGVQQDPEKTAAVRQMSAPTNLTELRRFFGMVNQMGKFSSNLAELSQPLRELLSKQCSWQWGQAQEDAFKKIKGELTKPTVLALYNPKAETKISADASSYGLGAVLLQRSQDTWRPVAYASRSMSDTERRYAQIEKEALAVTWACEKFSQYVLGMRFSIETDHKPLVPLLGSKSLDSLPPRILRFRLRLARYDYSINHTPGKLLYTADALSRAPINSPVDDSSLTDEAEYFMDTCIALLPASKTRMDEFAQAQATDPVCSQVIKYCQEGWPTKHNLDGAVKPYWNVRGELTLSNNKLLLYGK